MWSLEDDDVPFGGYPLVSFVVQDANVNTPLFFYF
jgi:hypothetical protein